MPIFNFFRNLENKSKDKATMPVGLDYSSLINIMRNENGSYVSADTALQNSDIFSLIMQLSGDLANVAYRTSHKRAQAIINNPTTTADAHGFWQSMFAQLLLGGESFAYRHRAANGIDLSWEYLRPSQVEVLLSEDGTELIYNATFDEPEVGRIEAIPANDMIHFRLMSKNGGKRGMSPLSALASELKIKDLSNKLTTDALSQSVTAPGVLSIKKGGLLDAKQKAMRSREFMVQQKNAEGGPIVIDDLEEYKPLEIKSNVAALLKQVDWTGTQIAKVYGVPDNYLNGTGDQQSSLKMVQNLYINSLNRYIRPIVSQLENKLGDKIHADIRPAVDPLGDQYASTVSTLVKEGTLAPNQAQYVLKEAGYFPSDLPEPILEGGETNEELNSN